LTILIMFFRCHSVSFSAYSTLSLHDALPISLFPGTDRQGTGIFRKYVGDLSQGRISPVIGNHHVAQDTGMGTARPNLTEGGMKSFNALLHPAFTLVLDIVYHGFILVRSRCLLLFLRRYW